MSDIAVINGEDKRELFAVPTCEIGIESTVVKINDETREVIVLRRGAITQKELEEAIGQVSGRSATDKVFEKIVDWRIVVVNTHDEMKKEGGGETTRTRGSPRRGERSIARRALMEKATWLQDNS